ncbi:MAG: sarcosine oxidase subunit gamma [Hyphomicrobiales bacterium]|nr:MAG: sarcosine oxidase subunit gamma [Hyphomicrobiales bacterium]
MVELTRRSPLSHRSPLLTPDCTCCIGERPFLGKLVLRCDPADAAALEPVLGTALPHASPQTTATDELTVLWLGPDEWMIVTAPNAEADLAARIEEALAGKPHQVVAVSDYYTVIEIGGSHAREALAKLTALDMHERAFKEGEVRGTVFAKAQAVIHMRSGTPKPAFDLYIRWSMADYLWCLLADAGHEFGMRTEQPIGGERLVI